MYAYNSTHVLTLTLSTYYVAALNSPFVVPGDDDEGQPRPSELFAEAHFYDNVRMAISQYSDCILYSVSIIL